MFGPPGVARATVTAILIKADRLWCPVLTQRQADLACRTEVIQAWVQRVRFGGRGSGSTAVWGDSARPSGSQEADLRPFY